jgi:DNA-binding NarL/FixJ family response regulator
MKAPLSPGSSNHNGSTTTNQRLRVVVVDDDHFMCEVIARMLRQQPERYAVVAEVGTVQEAAAVAVRYCPDLMLLDINLPDKSGIAAVPELRRACPAMRILLCTCDVTDERIIDALRSGAHGFIEKTNTWDDFTTAIEHVAAGEHYFCPRSMTALAHFSQPFDKTSRAQQLDSLSPRENEVLRLVSRGGSSKAAASELGVSTRTVDVHRSNLMKKLGVHNAAGLVAFAFEAGLMADFHGA